MADSEDKKSKLGEKLARVARGAPARIGFGATPGPKVPSLVLIVQVPTEAGVASAAVGAGADALLLEVAPGGRPDAQAIEGLRRAVPELPLGLAFGDAGDLSACREVAGDDSTDFYVAPLHSVPASILGASDRKMFLALDLRYLPHLARGVSGLPVQGAVIENERRGKGPLRLEDVLRYRLLADLISKPLIAAGGKWLHPDELVHLRDQGIEGVLVQASGSPAEVGERVGAFRQAIDALGTAPAATRRGLGRTPLVPAMRSPSSLPAEMPEEEPDEEPE